MKKFKNICSIITAVILAVTSFVIPSSAISNDTAKTIWDYLYSQIGNEYGVAGLMGNLEAESSLISINLEGSKEKKLGYTDSTYTAAVDNGSYSYYDFIYDYAGYGIAQWTYWSRKQKLINFALDTGRSIGDLQMQLDFLVSELKGNYSSTYCALVNATSVSDASDYVLLYYENPANKNESVKKYRTSLGTKYYDMFSCYSNRDTTPITQEEITANSSYPTGKYRVGNDSRGDRSGSNVRTGASTNYSRVGAASYGIEFFVDSVNGAWGHTSSILCTNGYREGYVNLNLCTLIYADTKSITSEKTIVYGDLNGDGKITITDLVKINNYISGNGTIDTKAADVDCNGVVDNIDADYIRKAINGLVTLPAKSATETIMFTSLSGSTNLRGYSTQVIDAYYGLSENETPLTLAGYHGGANQWFTLEKYDSEYYIIKADYCGKVWDINGNPNSSQYGNLQLYDRHNGDNQLFKLQKNNDNSYTIISKDGRKISVNPRTGVLYTQTSYGYYYLTDYDKFQITGK